jgi:alkylation response protein AidB-like acyl-CoA dehydrogenase
VDRAVRTPRRGVFDEEHEAFRDSVARFLTEQAVPNRDRWDSEGIDAEFWTVAAGYGFLGLAEAGDPRFAAVVLEEAMAAGLPAVALSLAAHESFVELAGREVPGLLAMVDGGALRAEALGAAWVLDGTAETVVNGGGAGLLLVIATDGTSELLFTVEPDAVGLHRSPADALLGLESCDVADLRLEAVTAADRLDAGPTAARTAHQLALAVAAMAGARTALADTVVYVKQRKAFGRAIAEFENTQHVLAGVGARVTAVGAYVDGCLGNAARLSPADAVAAKFCAADVLALAVDSGVQLHGGYGYMWEYPIARAYAAARFFRLHANAGEHTLLAGAVGL